MHIKQRQTFDLPSSTPRHLTLAYMQIFRECMVAFQSVAMLKRLVNTKTSLHCYQELFKCDDCV